MGEIIWLRRAGGFFDPRAMHDLFQTFDAACAAEEPKPLSEFTRIALAVDVIAAAQRIRGAAVRVCDVTGAFIEAEFA